MTTISAGFNAPYRGPDRRSRALATPSAHPRLRGAFVIAACLVAVGALATGAVLAFHDTATVLSVVSSLRNVAAVSLVAAGVALIAHWRFSGRAMPARAGIALLCAGTVGTALYGLAPMLYDDPVVRIVSPGTRTAAALPAIILLIRAARSAAVDARINAWRIALCSLATSATVLGAIKLAHYLGLSETTRLWAGVEMALAVGWWVAAVLLHRWGVVHGVRATSWMAVAVAGLGVAEVLRGVALIDPLSVLTAAAVVYVASAALLLGVAVFGLSQILAESSSTVVRLRVDLEDEHVRRKKFVHDACGRLASIRVAASTLERYGDRLDGETQHSLRDAVAAEVERLQLLLEEIDARIDVAPTTDAV